MDIIFTLPYPKEICSKIFIYTCKSEHNSLGINVLKHFTNTDSEDILDTNLLQNNDSLFTTFISSEYNFINIMKPLDIFKLGNFINMEKLIISSHIEGISSGVNGDIQVLKYMPNLKDIHITDSDIFGNISNLSSLYKLKYVNLMRTNITGDIKSLSKLMQLKTLGIINTYITGDILVLKTLPDLFCICLNETPINSNIEQLNDYREKNKLSHISILTY